MGWKGDWSALVPYAALDAVFDGGESFVAITTVPEGTVTSNTLYWQKMSQKGINGTNGVDGATGPQGPQGVQGLEGPIGPQGPKGITGDTGPQGAQGVQGVKGDPGNAGAAATITVGTVTTGAAGSAVSVTNSGTSSAATLNFTIPQGAMGATGPQGPAGSTSYDAGTAIRLTNTQATWANTEAKNNVVGMLSWRNYGNSHVIFDASSGVSPSGGAVNNTNSAAAWSATLPTLMGWNGSSTYGVRVDSARVADNGGVTSVNGSTGAVTVSAAAPTTAQVLSATAGLAAGAVGSYAYLASYPSNASITAGSTYAGSTLAWTSGNPDQFGATVSGTWRALSHCPAGQAYYPHGLFVRIA